MKLELPNGTKIEGELNEVQWALNALKDNIDTETTETKTETETTEKEDTKDVKSKPHNQTVKQKIQQAYNDPTNRTAGGNIKQSVMAKLVKQTGLERQQISTAAWRMKQKGEIIDDLSEARDEWLQERQELDGEPDKMPDLDKEEKGYVKSTLKEVYNNPKNWSGSRIKHGMVDKLAKKLNIDKTSIRNQVKYLRGKGEIPSSKPHSKYMKRTQPREVLDFRQPEDRAKYAKKQKKKKKKKEDTGIQKLSDKFRVPEDYIEGVIKYLVNNGELTHKDILNIFPDRQRFTKDDFCEEFMLSVIVQAGELEKQLELPGKIIKTQNVLEYKGKQPSPIDLHEEKEGSFYRNPNDKRRKR